MSSSYENSLIALPFLSGEDAKLLDGIRARDESALLGLYDRYATFAFGIIHHVIHDRGIAEELMQDIFFMLWRRPEVYDAGKGTLRSWIGVVSRHRAVDALRRRRPETSIEGLEFSKDGHQERDARLAEFVKQVQTILAKLPLEQQSVFQLAYFEGLSHSEICERTGQPLGTIKSRLRAALATLRASFVPRAA